jgi:hypothetical protein
MVIDDHHIDARRGEFRNLFDGYGAAIDRDQQVRRFALAHASLQGSAAQSIAFHTAARNECPSLHPVGLQNTSHESDGCHAIHVVITKNADLLPGIYRLQNAFHGQSHVWDQKRIG